MDLRWIVPQSPVLSRPFQTHVNMESCSVSINQSITVSCPRIGLSLQTEPSPFYPLLSLPFRIFIQPIYHKFVYHLISSTANFLPFIIASRASFSRQLLLSQWPSQFLFLFFISFSIILPPPTLSSTTAFFILSVHFIRSILLHIHTSNASSRFCSFFVVVQCFNIIHTSIFSNLIKL